MIRGGIILVALALLSPLPAVAQYWATADLCRIEGPRIYPQALDPDRKAIDEAAATKINGVGRLWKITTTDGAVSHLWGTFHSNDPTILNLPQELRDVLAQAQIVAGEYNPIPTSRRSMEAARDDSRFWRDASLDHEFSLPNKRVEGWVKSRFNTLGYGPMGVDWLTDLGVAETLLGAPCNDFLYGIFPIQDDRILLLGADAGAQILGLEEPDAFRATLSRSSKADTGYALLAVGSFHLPGPNGMVAILRDAGYHVERVVTAGEIP